MQSLTLGAALRLFHIAPPSIAVLLVKRQRLTVGLAPFRLTIAPLAALQSVNPSRIAVESQSKPSWLASLRKIFWLRNPALVPPMAPLKIVGLAIQLRCPKDVSVPLKPP